MEGTHTRVFPREWKKDVALGDKQPGAASSRFPHEVNPGVYETGEGFPTGGWSGWPEGAVLAQVCWGYLSSLGEGRGRGVWQRDRQVGPLKPNIVDGGQMAAVLGGESSGRTPTAAGGSDWLFGSFLFSIFAAVSVPLSAACSWGCGGGSWGDVNSVSRSQQVPSCLGAGERHAAHTPPAVCPKRVLTHPTNSLQKGRSCPEM